MAETLLSPGVLARENDLSAITAQPIQAGAAIIGPTVKGPVGIPTLVTSYSEYAQAFGTTFLSASLQQEFLTSNSAYNYFNNGGTTLLVTRVVSGSFTSATSTNISGSGVAVATSFTLKTFGEGAIMNSSGSEVDGALVSGSSDNLRWEVAGFSTSSGTFSLLIRRGDDPSAQGIPRDAGCVHAPAAHAASYGAGGYDVDQAGSMQQGRRAVGVCKPWCSGAWC